MRTFFYSDEKISTVDMTISISSMIIGIGILSLPRLIAEVTLSSDGWLSIMIAGIVSICLAWILAKLVARFPQQGFYECIASTLTKPVAIGISLIIAVYFTLFASYEVRSIADISKQYLFERTPVEVIALMFLVIVSYAAAGSRVGLIRLNTLFLPIVIVLTGVVLFFNLPILEWTELKPFFITDWRSVAEGAKISTFSLLGFEIIIYYVTLMNKPKEAPRAAVIGVAIPVVMYTAIYFTTVGVFNGALPEITYPAIELAKEMQIPGEFFERFESIFFTIWLMTVFNTTSMAFDLSLFALSSVFPSWKRNKWVFLLCPIVYTICMLPQNNVEFDKFGTFISRLGLYGTIFLPCLALLATIVVRRKRNHEN